MARKAVQGYTEKSYYENTEFKQTVATNDPLTEGSFAMMCNLDIADTGKSVKPRRGFITTTFKNTQDEVINLSTKIIYFKDNSSLKHIVIDLDNFETNAAHLVDISSYNIDKGLLKGAQQITKYDVEDLKKLFEDDWNKSDNDVKVFAQTVFKDSTIVSDITSKSILDINGVSSYIFKLKYSNSFSYYLKVYYNLKDDTLVLSLVDTEEQTRTLNPSLRNIASSKSLIPDPLRHMSTDLNEAEPSVIQGIPVLFEVQDEGEKYVTTQLPNKFKHNLEKVKLQPTFYLEHPEKIVNAQENSKWAFRWDIINTPDKKVVSETENIIRTPWYELTNPNGSNDAIPELLFNDAVDVDNNDTYILITDQSVVTPPISDGYIKHLFIEEVINVSPNSALQHLKGTARMYFKRLLLNDYIVYNSTIYQSAYYSTLNFRTQTRNNPIELIENLLEDKNNLTEEEVLQFNTNKFRFIKLQELIDLDVSFTESVNFEEQLNSETTLIQSYYIPGRNYFSNGAISTPHLIIDKKNYDKLKKYSPEEVFAIIQNYKNKKDMHVNIYALPYTTSCTISNETIYTFSDFNNVVVEGLNAFVYDTDNFNKHDSYATYQTREEGFFSSDTWYKTYVRDAVLKKTRKYFLKIDSVQALANFNETELSTLKNVITEKIEIDDMFKNGASFILYLRPYDENELVQAVSNSERYAQSVAWDNSSYIQTGMFVWEYDKPTYITEIEEDEYKNLQEAKNFIIFKDKLIVYNKNIVYMSEEGAYNTFLKKNKFEFNEEVLKVIEFKTILLVFTTQHLYAIYEEEFTRLEEEEVAPTEEGKAPTTKTKEVKYNEWVKQPVLYNISTSRKYLNTIQVFNQMILFYSNEGQLYMIKPSTTIDSETQFSIQYFNKSANNIFANYDEYINQRLLQYNKIKTEDFSDFITKDDVEVNAIMDIDKIIITYSVNKIAKEITMFLIYDVVNNRYTVYDTLSFSGIVQPDYIDNGYLYVTQDTQATYFTLPYLKNNNIDENVDINFAQGLQKKPIYTLLDTGVIDLNNHLMKRFREFYITLKNLDATSILYNVEVVIDDVVIKNFYAPSARVIMSNGPDETLTIEKATEKELNEIFGLIQTFGVSGSRDNIESYELFKENFYEDNKLLKLETINSNKMIEYKTQILGRGKSLRLRIQFISKGDYKLQSYGIVYKERRV